MIPVQEKCLLLRLNALSRWTLLQLPAEPPAALKSPSPATPLIRPTTWPCPVPVWQALNSLPTLTSRQMPIVIRNLIPGHSPTSAPPPINSDCTVHYTGSCSLKLAGNNTQKTAYQTVTKSGGVAGDDYTFSLWSDASSVPSAATYQLQVQFLNGSTVIKTQTLNFTTGNHTFQKVSGTFTATGVYTKITFTIVFKAASGTAWFDTAALNYAP